MLSEYRVGPITTVDGGVNPGRTDRFGSLAVTQGKAKYADAVSRGNMYFAANQGGVTLSVLSTTATGFILTNPKGSGKYLIVYEIAALQTGTAGAANNSGLQVTFGPYSEIAVIHTTPLTVNNCILGYGNVGVGLVDSAATLPVTPVSILSLWQQSISATATTAIPPQVLYRTDGLLAVSPGCSISMSSLGTAKAVATSMIWEEVSI